MIIIPKLNIIKIFMRLRRIYYPFVVNNNKIIIISDEKAHYLRSVLRYQVGQKLHIFNQQQQEFFAEILVIKKKQIELKLLEEVKPIKPSCLDLCLVQSISKGERMDYSVQKATELGVNRIQPIFSEFGDVKLKGERLNKKVNHWQNIAISACEQSFRADIPQILTP
ncbi:MAG TPA: 16S rRNA (uracil(1498)-N(3))-methyltransferase, partial [Oceanospirillales bacterium]|nr:16S rRNA (uracil(1498)-N(3))-methyltransferase [Oceanospirillales bacterium]